MAGPDWTAPADDSIASVRPFGYRSADPVVRRIGDRDLCLGNVHAADPNRHDRSFDAVLSLTCESQPATTVHRPLIDGLDTDWAAFASAADAACRLLGEGSLLIHCAHGISRSAAVTAVALAVAEGRPLADALAAVRSARPPATVHPALFEQALVYVTARR